MELTLTKNEIALTQAIQVMPFSQLLKIRQLNKAMKHSVDNEIIHRYNVVFGADDAPIKEKIKYLRIHIGPTATTMHLTNIRDAINIIRNGISDFTYVDVIRYGKDFGLLREAESYCNGKDIRCALFYNVDKFSRNRIQTDWSGLRDEGIGFSDKAIGEYIVRGDTLVNPDFIIVIAEKKTQLFNELISLGIPCIIITDVPDLIQKLVETWEDIEHVHARYVELYPPDTYNYDDLSLEDERQHVFMNYMGGVLDHVLDPKVTRQVNENLDANLNPHEHQLLYAYMMTWLANSKHNGSAEMEEQEGDYLLDEFIMP